MPCIRFVDRNYFQFCIRDAPLPMPLEVKSNSLEGYIMETVEI